MTNKKLKIYKKYIQPLVLIIILYVIISFLYKNSSEVKQIFLNIDIKWIPIVVIAICIASFCKAFFWSYLVKNMGSSLSYSRLIAIWHYSLIGGYIPGSIWMIVGRVYQLQKENISKKKAIYAVGLEQIFTLAVAFFIVFLTPQIMNQIKIPVFIGFIMAPLFLVVLFPRFWGNILWKMKIRFIDFRLIPKIPIYVFIIYFIGTLLSYYIVGICVLLTLKLFNIYAPSINIFNATAMPASSFIVGYLTFLTPSGIGVKEGVYSFLLSAHMPYTIALLFAISGRIWLLLSHLISIPIESWKIMG